MPTLSTAEQPTLRIDAHQHFWRYDPKVQTFIDDSMQVLQRDFLPDHLKSELDAAKLTGCVAVQAAQSLEETRWLLELSDVSEFIRGVVGWVDLRSDQLEGDLEELCERPRLCGVRHIIQEEPDEIFTDERFRRGVARLARFDLSYDMLVYERQLPLAYEFMKDLDGTSFILDHLGKPNLREPNLREFLEVLRPIADLPQVVCKLSGLVTEADFQHWTPQELVPFIEGALELFGIDRLLFGSDWPVCLLAGSYAEVYGLVDDYFREFSESERAKLFGRNAARVYQLPREISGQ